MEFEQRLVIGIRPVEAPEGWTIFNAPRPLFGSLHPVTEDAVTWTGDFATGRLYAAVSPTDELRHKWLQQNKRLAAVVLHYISEDEAKQMARTYIAENIDQDIPEEIFAMMWKDIFYSELAWSIIDV